MFWVTLHKMLQGCWLVQPVENKSDSSCYEMDLQDFRAKHLSCNISYVAACFVQDQQSPQYEPLVCERGDGHYGRTGCFCWMFLEKIRPLSSAHSFKLQSGFYFGGFWSSGVFLSAWPLRLCQYSTCFPVDVDIFVSVPRSICTRPFAIVLALIRTFLHQSKFTCSERGEASFS